MLRLKKLVFGYPSKRRVINDLSFSFEKGKVYALLGANGAGKTTVFNLICGYIKPQSGDIYINDAKITKSRPYRINQNGVGRTFQNLRLISQLTVKENVVLSMKNDVTDKFINAMLPKQVFAKTVRRLDEEAKRIINQYFLEEVVDSMASEISYGQQKLLSMACCVANEASVLLFDEVVAGIQPVYREKIHGLIKVLKEEGKTIIVIEHNIDFVAGICDHILFLINGKVLKFNNIDELKKDPIVKKGYL